MDCWSWALYPVGLGRNLQTWMWLQILQGGGQKQYTSTPVCCIWYIESFECGYRYFKVENNHVDGPESGFQTGTGLVLWLGNYLYVYLYVCLYLYLYLYLYLNLCRNWIGTAAWSSAIMQPEETFPLVICTRYGLPGITYVPGMVYQVWYEPGMYQVWYVPGMVYQV